jgi:hypothetical protein
MAIEAGAKGGTLSDDQRAVVVSSLNRLVMDADFPHRLELDAAGLPSHLGTALKQLQATQDGTASGAVQEARAFNRQLIVDLSGGAVAPADFAFPINPQWFWMWTMGICTLLYIAVSLIERKSFNMEKMLHRGKYAVESGQTHTGQRPTFRDRLFGIDQEFTRGDRLTAYVIMGWFLVWLGVFLVGTIYAVIFDPGEAAWASFWHVYLWILFFLAIGVTVWFTIGGLRDIRSLFRTLKSQERDFDDDGMVRHDSAENEAEPENDKTQI